MHTLRQKELQLGQKDAPRAKVKRVACHGTREGSLRGAHLNLTAVAPFQNLESYNGELLPTKTQPPPSHLAPARRPPRFIPTASAGSAWSSDRPDQSAGSQCNPCRYQAGIKNVCSAHLARTRHAYTCSPLFMCDRASIIADRPLANSNPALR